MVLGICSVAVITYATSAFFIFFLSDYLGGLLGVNENIFTVITLVLGVMWCGVLGFIGATVIAKPLHRLEKAAGKVASGDISEHVEVPKSDDELRGLALAYNNMVDNLRSMVQDIDRNFMSTNERVAEINGASLAAAEQADNISRTVDEISQGAENSAASIQETAESVEDVMQIATQVQNHAQTSNRLSEDMVETLAESKEVITSLVEGIQQLAKDNETSLTAVHRLEKNAKKVEEIISLVGDIAGQTNLLALNASIEAARAGEQGRGFAVVAEEVRKLADESGKAVQGISSLIKSIQSEVTNVVGQITDQVQVAKKEADKGSATNEAIADMGESVTEVAKSVAEISILVEKQMKSVEASASQSEEVAAIAQETSAGAVEVSSATQEQSAVMEEIAAASEILSEEAGNLKKVIQKFHV
ncbi:methyl-accepting chemotaxis protein [Alteribacter keqinensis]|uniref:Methyl-accepting chemotaxis protein n=2 Tax=Alteribacter keqinensis TaxID=2483800 RepID=A0A3M7TS25_9BACI|nr:methyl-accepting chemotaxis protein [Alteribacter keqinensis]RNA68077.1 methyl-accepting chemotaxis protein [Alteribacter keqinensis]